MRSPSCLRTWTTCRYLLALAGWTLFTGSAAALAADQWQQWRGPQRDGVDHDSPPLIQSLPEEGLEPVWLNTELPRLRSGGWSSPVIADGRLYLFAHHKEKKGEQLPPRKYPWLPPEKRGGMTPAEYEEYERKRRDEDEARSKQFVFVETVYCLDAQTGESIWTNERTSAYTRFPQSGSPAVIDGRIYLLGAGRVARCLDAQTGDDLWEQTLPGEFRDEFIQSSFVVADGVAAVLANRLFALDAKTGKILWQSESDDQGAIHSSPVVWHADGESYFIANIGRGTTACYHAQDGRRLWEVDSGGGHSTPVVSGDRLLTYGSSRKQGLRCYRLSTAGAELEWTFQRAADPGSSPVVLGDRVFVQGDRRLACVELETGRTLWSTTLDLNRPRYTSLIAADGKVIYAFEGVLCFDGQSDDYTPLMEAVVSQAGRLGEEEMFRKQLGIDKLEQTAEGQKEAERVWRKEIGNSGPLACTTPAIHDGKLYLRLRNGVACYDLAR